MWRFNPWKSFDQPVMSPVKRINKCERSVPVSSTHGLPKASPLHVCLEMNKCRWPVHPCCPLPWKFASSSSSRSCYVSIHRLRPQPSGRSIMYRRSVTLECEEMDSESPSKHGTSAMKWGKKPQIWAVPEPRIASTSPVRTHER